MYEKDDVRRRETKEVREQEQELGNEAARSSPRVASGSTARAGPFRKAEWPFFRRCRFGESNARGLANAKRLSFGFRFDYFYLFAPRPAARRGARAKRFETRCTSFDLCTLTPALPEPLPELCGAGCVLLSHVKSRVESRER